MIREFLACYDYSKGPAEVGCPKKADLLARILLSSKSLINDDNKKKKERRKWQGNYARHEIKPLFTTNKSLLLRIIKTAALQPPSVSLPEHSWFLQFPFRLRKPYLSGDETDFYLFENPVRKDWVFKVPCIAASQWKGMLRSVMIQEMVTDLKGGRIGEDDFWYRRHAMWCLFGNENDGTGDYLDLSLAMDRKGSAPDDETQYKGWFEGVHNEAEKIGEFFKKYLIELGMRGQDVEGFRGSLYFYPTWFNDIGLEVINPHRRDTGAGTLPIYMECVPKDTCGEFKLLYAPLSGSNEEIRFWDLDLVISGLWKLLTVVGIGAKTSSGFGLADILRNGTCESGPLFSGQDEFHTHCYLLIKRDYGSGTQPDKDSMKTDGE